MLIGKLVTLLGQKCPCKLPHMPTPSVVDNWYLGFHAETPFIVGVSVSVPMDRLSRLGLVTILATSLRSNTLLESTDGNRRR